MLDPLLNIVISQSPAIVIVPWLRTMCDLFGGVGQRLDEEGTAVVRSWRGPTLFRVLLDDQVDWALDIDLGSLWIPQS